MRRTTRLLRRVVMVATAAVTAAVLTNPAALAQPDPDPGADGEPVTSPTHQPVVFIGAPGLSWQDITEATPNLAALTRETGASLIVRSVRASACPADGWLALSAGNRAGDLPGPCRTLTEPGADGRVPGWDDYQQSADELSYRARLGTFARALTEEQVEAVGIGPGAAIALADEEGIPLAHQHRQNAGVALTTQTTTAAREADLLVVDAGTVSPVPRPHKESYTDEDAPLLNPTDEDAHRADQLRLLDRRVGSVLTGLQAAGTSPVVVLAGLADDGSPGLRVLAVTGDDGEDGLGTSPASRQRGYVMTTDLLPTLLTLLGADPPQDGAVIGAPMRVEPTDMTAAERQEFLIGQDVHAQAVRPITPTYYLIMVILNLVLFAALAVGLKRPSAERVRAFLQPRWPAVAQRLTNFTVNRSRVLRGMRIAALGIASLPVASFLANIVPWWQVTPPALGLAVFIALFVAVIVAVALAGPWRRHVLGAPTVVAAVTALVLIADIATGARMQVDAVMGVSTLVAGRMYGMNNTAFTLFTVSTLMVTITIANHLVQRGKRVWAGVLVGVLGIAAAVFDGAPGLGADFGGPPALLPAYAILALLAAGVRLSVLRVAVVLGVAALATLTFAFVDWLRPPQDRTHLGAFFQTILDGGAGEVILRNLQANLGILFGNTPLTLLALAGVLTVVFVFARPIRSAIRDPGLSDSLARGTPLGYMGEAAPMLPPGITAIAVGLGIGMAVNDSGVAILAVGVAVGVPLLVAASCTWMLGLSRRPAGTASGADPVGTEPREGSAAQDRSPSGRSES